MIAIAIMIMIIMIIMIIIGKCSPKLVQLISPCHLSPPSTKSSSTKELQLSLSSNNSRYVHVVESWNNHSRFLLTKLRMISICDYTCRGGLLDLEDIILHSDIISRSYSDLELEYFVALCSKCIALPPCLLNTLLKKMSTFDRFPLKSFWIRMVDDKRPEVNHNIHLCWLGLTSSRNPGTNLGEILLEQMHLVGNN